jgi:cysteine desulfurase
METIYLDHAAATPVRPEVLEAMLPWFSRGFANSSSLHRSGQEAKRALEEARERVAACLGAEATEVLFTAGGTESDNLAVQGVLRAGARKGRRHIVTSAIEHRAVLNCVRALEREGCEATFLPPDRSGVVDPDALRQAVRSDTALVSIMLANNETGAIQPAREIAHFLRERGIPFHTDAVQAVGKMSVDVRALGADLLSLSAHKFNGPKGVGALYVRQGTPIEALLHGGGQERLLRPGTENIPAIVGLARALALAQDELTTWPPRLSALRDRLEQALFRLIPDEHLNGPPAGRLPHILNIAFAGVEGESLLLALDAQGIRVSTGSACASGETESSHVLRAMGIEPALARGSLRFSVGIGNTPEQMDRAAGCVAQAVAQLRRASPLSGVAP